MSSGRLSARSSRGMMQFHHFQEIDTMAYDTFSQLVGDELSSAIAGKYPFVGSVASHRGALSLVCLSNAHFGTDRLLCHSLPPDELIPHRYEGNWQKPAAGLAAEPTERQPVWHDGGILERFGNCAAIYA